jgi:hypothetical protein
MLNLTCDLSRTIFEKDILVLTPVLGTCALADVGMVETWLSYTWAFLHSSSTRERARPLETSRR